MPIARHARQHVAAMEAGHCHASDQAPDYVGASQADEAFHEAILVGQRQRDPGAGGAQPASRICTMHACSAASRTTSARCWTNTAPSSPRSSAATWTGRKPPSPHHLTTSWHRYGSWHADLPNAH
jgi:hypothetical protein